MTDIEAIKDDFRNFLYLIWKHLNLPDPTPVQYDIADFLQSGNKRLVIEAFRGVGKSWITSAYVVWLLFKDPQLNILVVSASKQRADDFSTFTLRLLQDIPFLNHLVPLESQRSSKIAFDVAPARASHAPSVKSVGITGQITGSRADVIIADDVEVINNSLTQMLRDRLSESVKEFEAVLKPKTSYGQIIFLGTPQTEQSLYNELPNRGYNVRIWPARFPDKGKLASYSGRLAPMIQEPLERAFDSEALGEPCSDLEARLGVGVTFEQSGSGGLTAALAGAPTDPQRFSEDELQEREVSYGRSGFALQFMLDTTLSDSERYPLKLADLMIMELDREVGPEKVVWGTDPELVRRDLQNVGFAGDRFHRPKTTVGEFVPWQGSVMAIDPSGRGGDETAYAIVKMLNGQLFLTACGGFLGGYSESTLEALANKAKDHKVNYVVTESNFGDGMFTQLLRPVFGRIYPCSMEEVRHTSQKEKRIIDTLEPVMNQHLLVIDSSVVIKDHGTKRPDLSPGENLTYQLFHQMTRLTKDRGCLRHDDRLESLSMAVNYWVERMGHDVERDMEQRRHDLMEAEIERFLAQSDGDEDPNWLPSSLVR